MTRKKSPTKLKTVNKKPNSIEEIMESLGSVGAEVKKIAKLHAKENILVAELLVALETVPQKMFSIGVSTSELPFREGAFTQAHIDATGQLILTSADGNLIVKDLREARNRDLMMAVVGDIVPKFKDFASQLAEEKPPEVEEIPPPEPVQPVPVEEEVPVEVPEVEVPSVQEEVPVELPSHEVESVPDAVPVLSSEEKGQMEQITEETLQDLEVLGNEVFTESPVSVYFDDWLVHLRQVILAFESSGAIKVDELFTDECEQIYRDIEEELANRLLKEAELEASAKTLAEKKNILGKMDAEYTTQSKYLMVRGKSAMDFLIKNVQRLEEELEKIHQIKTLNPIKRIAKQQKKYTVTKKLNAAKQKLAVAAQNAEAEQKRIQDEYEKKKQTEIQNMQSLEKEIATKKTDNSLKARKAATKALAKAVESLVQRNLEPPEGSTT